ncbi:uncharacterized protein MELLADRAFT_90521 [Melampsora larici-populina 98AG31]|uniref:Uncharacterized protein n=1 Tax=Melampsora larici-populina (strain 98AG31 / pathotype 3-4-7) TaxID=747676 RepID=F4RX71_MELLP|nr:uncharacterized protein MELLADRAFT_90521 [Melampsora larici-populina 98AG31]EGG03039.1 hypothetical protein MELLADRAFT_90521 [Melampsora larici-populina 98AG31]
MTATMWPEERVQAFKPDFVAPLVGYLTSETNEETSGQLYEASGGWCAAIRWQRSYGLSVRHLFILVSKQNSCQLHCNRKQS